jgi:hypothetical protein
MASVVVDAAAVGQVVTYVAPGFLARLGYRARYPGLDRPAGEVFIVSVVLSLPLVALVTALLPGEQTATQLGYVAVLLGLALAVGYVAALIRGRPKVKDALAKAGYTLDPEGTIYTQTLKHLSETATVTVELKDGRRISGCPRSGPQSKDDGVNELYLVYAEALDENGEWQSLGGPAAISPLSEVASVVLSEEPTGTPVA